MPGFEYKIVPAPDRAKKIRGAKGAEARFAATLEETLNEHGSDGWEFVRSEVFSVEERAGLTGKKTVDRQVMVFRKPLPEPAEPAPAPAVETEDVPEQPHEIEAQPEFSHDGRGPKILGRPIPPMSRPAETAPEPD